MAVEKQAGPAAVVLAATAARRYYFDGASKSDIAGELGLSRFKVARLLDQALASGLVRIELHSPGTIDLDLSIALKTAYGLRHCVVIDSPEDDEALLRANLGRAAAELLTEIVEPHDVLGLAWARSLMAMRRALVELAPCAVVQLTGALSRPDVDESSIELVRDVARIAGGLAYYFYAPMIVADAMTAAALRAQPEIARAMRRFPDVTKAIVGVGAWRAGQSTVADAVSATERREIRDLGVRVEVCGVQLDAAGTVLTTPLTDRLIGIDATALRAIPDVIAIAYGAPKAEAVRATVRSGIVSSLVTHAAMASALLEPA